ncbi:flagellar hook-associated protein FlgL [Sphingomonas sp. 2R-10]|uniref:flagellar hook-associated protein FlgL n=1 Tax=Sphingomonas sp. 2R-10 TaxID=3045148 RepID=UPI0013DDAE4C|nr:flagellar hook-associated protein FlgL [Sphingomonas sp. 2R-10]MDJ0276542.1 flagellar hook-associated protein FlgL [Sphingomonas sp. 2R-10]
MQISTASFYNRSASQMSKLTSDLDRINTELSTQKRLNVASKDSTAWMMLGGIKKEEADSTAFRANITLSRGLLAQSDTALDNVGDRLVRVRELATRAGSETLNFKDRTAIATELGQIREGLLVMANARDVRGHPVFGGTGDSAFTKDPTTQAISYTGNESVATVRIGEASEMQVGIDGRRVFGGDATMTGVVDVFKLIDDLTAAMQMPLTANDPPAPVDPAVDPTTIPPFDEAAARTKYTKSISDALTRLDSAEGQVSSARAANGARAARLEIESTQLDAIGLDREEARSALEDTDWPTTMVEFQKTMTILNATQASVAKLAGLSLFNYLK